MNDTIKEYNLGYKTNEELEKEINRMWNKFPATDMEESLYRFSLLAVKERIEVLKAVKIAKDIATLEENNHEVNN